MFLIHSFIYLFFLVICTFSHQLNIQSFFCLLIRLLIYSLVHSLGYSFIQSFSRWFVGVCIHPSIHWSIWPFIYLFIHSLFIRFLFYPFNMFNHPFIGQADLSLIHSFHLWINLPIYHFVNIFNYCVESLSACVHSFIFSLMLPFINLVVYSFI